MQILVILACAIAAVSAGYIAPVAPVLPQNPTYLGPQHLPIIGSNGVPVDTPAVQQATAEHSHHKIEAHVRNGDYVAPVYPASYPTVGYPTYTGVPITTAAGLPLDTPEVAAAKAAHFTAHANAIAQTGHVIAKRGVIASYHTPTYPAIYNSYSADSFPYPHHTEVVYRKRRGIVAAAPIAYSGYSHVPVSAYSAYPYYV